MSTAMNESTAMNDDMTNGAAVTTTPVKLTRKDFMSDQEMRWCPGCGDYGITAALQLLLPELGVQPHELVFISGIGCAARLPYYMDTYGIHSIHGRAPAVATGVALTRPDLSVWVIGGDGDMLSIGANHLIHALRRNVDLKILMFNNQIYGLTKGQYSPTSEVGKVTKSSPMGAVDQPFNPVSLALGAEASFVGRVMESDRPSMMATLRAAAEHRGTALVEIYQNCPIFNDGAFEKIKDRSEQEARLVRLEAGQPVRVGAEDARRVLVRTPGGALEFVLEDQADPTAYVVHDPYAEDPSQAFALSRLDSAEMTSVPVGIFRQVERPTYDDQVRAQVAGAQDAAGGPATDADLAALLRGKDTWTVA